VLSLCCILASRCLVTVSNYGLCFRAHVFTGWRPILQHTHCSNWLTPRLAAISQQPHNLLHFLILDLIYLITFRDEPHREHHSSVAVFLLLSGSRRKHHSFVDVSGPLPSNGRCIVAHLAFVAYQPTFYPGMQFRGVMKTTKILRDENRYFCLNSNYSPGKVIRIFTAY
jgi:hypothetical protein